MYSLDVETRSKVTGRPLYALEPWRVRQNKAEISSIAVCRPDDSVHQIVNNSPSSWRSHVIDLIDDLAGCVVYAHNAVFDIAWLLSTIEPEKFRKVPESIKRIRWRDTMLLTKWLINGQKPELIDFSYSLVNLVSTFLPNHPLTPEFVTIKSMDVVAGENDQYWEERGLLDVRLTRALAEKLQPLVPEKQRVGLMTEFSCLIPVANSWINGLRVNVDDIERVEYGIQTKMDTASNLIQVPSTVLNSPKQLSNLLFNQWGLTPLNHNKNGGSTAKDDLKMIQYMIQDGDPGLAAKMNAVMEFKENSTLKSKYIKTLKEALSYTGDGYIYGSPRIFATYTGRMTYSNATKDKNGPKVSIALHQLPRKAKEVRGLLCSPEGMGILEDDASGQESRLMAIRSGDQTMLKVFCENKNLHSMTGSAIIGMDYDEFMRLYKEEGEDGGYYTEQRQLGKLTNLSCNYRIGGPALAQKAFTKYDTYMTNETGRFLVNTFKRQYSAIPIYWNSAIEYAKAMGYTDCFGGRKYKITEWGGRDVWTSESSAIMFPIQGGGAAMKEIAIAVLFAKFPEVFFCLDLHDATFSYCQDVDKMKEISNEVLDCLNGINYEHYWGFNPACPLTYEAGCGLSFKEVK